MRVALRIDSTSLLRRVGAALERLAVDHVGSSEQAELVITDRVEDANALEGTLVCFLGPACEWSGLRDKRTARFEEGPHLEAYLDWIVSVSFSPSIRFFAEHPDSIAVLREGVISRTNASFDVALDDPELVGRRLETLVHPDDVERWAALSAMSKDYETLRLLRGDGTVFVTDCSLVPFGVDTAAVFRCRREPLERRLMVADRLASVGTLAAGVAHELNNPLSYLLSNLQLSRELALELGVPAKGFVESMDTAIEGARRMASIVRDLKTFARGGGSRVSVIEVEPALRAAIGLCEHELNHRGLFFFRIDPLPTVEINASRLSQVFLNLLINASHALEGVAKGRVELIARTGDDGWAEISISDNGAGIRPGDMPRIFDPFFTTKAGLEGAGLGLSISRRLVTDVGGTLSVESAPGEGATFTVRLPPASRLPCDKVESSIPPAASSRAHVLIVDDERLIGRAMERALRAHDVSVASSGEEALVLMRERTFDIVFCDVMMPTFSGIDVYVTIAEELPEYAERFIFMTGGAFTAETQAFLANTSCGVIEKPFDLKEIRRRVAAALRPD